jgi:hypothetical protein
MLMGSNMQEGDELVDADVSRRMLQASTAEQSRVKQ